MQDTLNVRESVGEKKLSEGATWKVNKTSTTKKKNGDIRDQELQK